VTQPPIKISRPLSASAALAALGLIATLMGPGCETEQRIVEPETVLRSSPPPAYASVATRYNARVLKLDRVRSTAGLIVTRPDGEGGTTSDQVEGNLQFQRPRNLNLRIDKVGQTVFVLGSNNERYWWFDLADENRARIGTHEKATRHSVEKFGVPVQPADLAELMGVLPLDPAADAKTNWSSDGRHVVAQFATPRGARWMWLDPTTLEPVRIDLINRFGERSLTAELSKYAVVPVTGDALSKPRMATLVLIDLPSQKTTIKLTLSEPTNPANAMKPRAFDLAALTDAYGIEAIEDLDAALPPPPLLAVPTVLTPKPTPDPAQSEVTEPKPTPPQTKTPPTKPAPNPAASPATRPAASPAARPETRTPRPAPPALVPRREPPK